MFQSLSQGSTISVFYRNTRKVFDGRVMSVNTHMPQYNPQQPLAMMNGPVTDITVQIGNETVPFVGLPANGVVANFQDKGIFIAIDQSAIIREVESMLNASEQIIASVPVHEEVIRDCKALLVELKPELKKDAQQMEEMNAMRNEFAELKKLILGSLEHNKKDK